MIKFQSQDILNRLNFHHPATWLSTWGGAGLLKPAPGTWGTVAALPFGIFFLYFGGVPSLLLAIAICFPVGLWASKHFEGMIHEKDSSMIVIDEVVGMWIALIPVTLAPVPILLAFILFRFFDILKPTPIGYLDKKFKGPMGVMIDDVVAGIFAALIIIGLRYAGLL